MKKKVKKKSKKKKMEEKTFNVFSKENIEEMERLNTQYQEFDKKREIIIKESRDVLKFSKKSIFSVHRNDLKGSKENLILAKNKIESLVKIFSENSTNTEENLRNGAFSSSMVSLIEKKKKKE